MDISKKLMFQQTILNIKNAGYEDITTEVVQLKSSKGVLKFKFYTKSQWETPEHVANNAQIVMGKSKNGFILPDYVVEYKNPKKLDENGKPSLEVYFVKIINKEDK